MCLHPLSTKWGWESLLLWPLSCVFQQLFLHSKYKTNVRDNLDQFTPFIFSSSNFSLSMLLQVSHGVRLKFTPNLAEEKGALSSRADAGSALPWDATTLLWSIPHVLSNWEALCFKLESSVLFPYLCLSFFLFLFTVVSFQRTVPLSYVPLSSDFPSTYFYATF